MGCWVAGWVAGGIGWVEGDGTVCNITIDEMNELLELATPNNLPSASPLPCAYYGPYHSSPLPRPLQCAQDWLGKPRLGPMCHVGNYSVVWVVERGE